MSAPTVTDLFCGAGGSSTGTPPVMQWITGRILQALEAAA